MVRESSTVDLNESGWRVELESFVSIFVRVTGGEKRLGSLVHRMVCNFVFEDSGNCVNDRLDLNCLFRMAGVGLT